MTIMDILRYNNYISHNLHWLIDFNKLKWFTSSGRTKCIVKWYGSVHGPGSEFMPIAIYVICIRCKRIFCIEYSTLFTSRHKSCAAYASLYVIRIVDSHWLTLLTILTGSRIAINLVSISADVLRVLCVWVVMALLSSVRVCDYYKVPGGRLCNSDYSMSPEAKRHIPPTSDTIQTKPFPIRGK